MIIKIIIEINDVMVRSSPYGNLYSGFAYCINGIANPLLITIKILETGDN
jgi:hypothetical protein